MPKYQVACNCKTCITVDAPTIEEAREQLKKEMTPATVAAHCYDFHGKDPAAITKTDIDELIERDTKLIP